jgi:hypothetical protein
MDARPLALGVAAGRIAFGSAFLLAPGVTAKGWIGRPARTPGGQVMTRAMGARDLAIGVGTLAALRGADDTRPWLAAALFSDLADAAATWAERGALGPARTGMTLAIAFSAAASSALALAEDEA